MDLVNYYGNANKTGIYCIRNLKNNKVYIGSTKTSFMNRKNKHLRLLRKGSHYNEYLQNSWNYYSEDSFTFEVLLLCSPDECIKNEGNLIKLYSSNIREHGYNIACVTEYRFGYKLSEIHLRERSEKKKEKSLNMNSITSDERGMCKPFKVYDINGKLIKEYISGIEYNLDNNTHARSMLSGILSKRKLYYIGKIFLYSNETLSNDDIIIAQSMHEERKPKKVLLYDLNNTYICTFESANLCAEHLRCKTAEIRMCCLGRRSRIKTNITKYENRN